MLWVLLGVVKCLSSSLFSMVCVLLVLLLIRNMKLLCWFGKSISFEYMFDSVLVCYMV